MFEFIYLLILTGDSSPTCPARARKESSRHDDKKGGGGKGGDIAAVSHREAEVLRLGLMVG